MVGNLSGCVEQPFASGRLSQCQHTVGIGNWA
jgi:hypothetical protein